MDESVSEVILLIGLAAGTPILIVAKKDFPASTLAEAVEVIKREGDRLNYANAGIGAASHLCGMLLMDALETPGWVPKERARPHPTVAATPGPT